jgi:pyridoxal phosphate enzyme (YggS family)
MESPPAIRVDDTASAAGSPPGWDRLRANLARLRGRIEAARGRNPYAAEAVKVVLVTKSVPAPFLAWLPGLGATDVGENRVQAAEQKRAAGPVDLVRSLTWHGIGHVQTNKARRAIDLFDVFHALDSVHLADRFEAVLAETGRTWPVYAQVNAARDPAKGGVAPEEALGFLAALAERPHLRVEGLMTMAREDDGGESARPAFRCLREIRDEAVRAGTGRTAPKGLSMGMSDDFEVAVEEGATVVRVGRAAWEGVTTAAGGVAATDAAAEGD